MKFAIYTDAVLVMDVPAQNLRRGDLVKLVDHHVTATAEEGYSVEILNGFGDTVGVACVSESALKPLSEDDVLSVRPLVAAR